MLDGGGLSLLVLPTGTKLWLWRYQFQGGEKNMTFGEYPIVCPKDARELHFAAKKLLATGVNPMAERKAEAEAKQQEARAFEREADSSFENVALQWWEWWSIGKSPVMPTQTCGDLEQTSFLRSAINPWPRLRRARFEN